jgi:hypothetical protein
VREGSKLANRKLQLGLSRCKLVFLMAMLASREGAGRISCRKAWVPAGFLRWALLMRAIK